MRGNFFYKRLGDRLTTMRKARCISQEELAYISCVDRTYIARIENGKSNPTVKVLNKICRCLKIRLSTLLEGV